MTGRAAALQHPRGTRGSSGIDLALAASPRDAEQRGGAAAEPRQRIHGPAGVPASVLRPGPAYLVGAGGGCSAIFTGCTEGLNVASRSAIWPWRDRSIDCPRMRVASCGAWKPVEFSAST